MQGDTLGPIYCFYYSVDGFSYHHSSWFYILKFYIINSEASLLYIIIKQVLFLKKINFSPVNIIILRFAEYLPEVDEGGL